MDVILLEQISKLGKLGDQVKVKDGFARNFLFPRNKAVLATPQNVAMFEARRVEAEKANLENIRAAQKSNEKISDLKLVMMVVYMVRSMREKLPKKLHERVARLYRLVT